MGETSTTGHKLSPWGLFITELVSKAPRFRAFQRIGFITSPLSYRGLTHPTRLSYRGLTHPTPLSYCGLTAVSRFETVNAGSRGRAAG